MKRRLKSASAARRQRPSGSARRAAAQQHGRVSARAVADPAIRKVWRNDQAAGRNFQDAGLAVDVNSAHPAPRSRVGTIPEELRRRAERAEAIVQARPSDGEKAVISDLFRRYGHDYEAMARDKANSMQHTPSVLRRKVGRLLKGV